MDWSNDIRELQEPNRGRVRLIASPPIATHAMPRLRASVLSMIILAQLTTVARIGSTSGAATIEAGINGNDENGKCLEMEPTALDRGAPHDFQAWRD
jgi:hypothetical protein